VVGCLGAAEFPGTRYQPSGPASDGSERTATLCGGPAVDGAIAAADPTVSHVRVSAAVDAIAIPGRTPHQSEAPHALACKAGRVGRIAATNAGPWM